MKNLPQPVAFPSCDPISGEVYSDGMGLRDFFAAHIAGHLSASPLRQDCTTESDAAYAYQLADALVAEGQRTSGAVQERAELAAESAAMLEIIRGFLANVMAPNPHPQDMDFVCASAQSLIERVTGVKFQLDPDDNGKAND